MGFRPLKPARDPKRGKLLARGLAAVAALGLWSTIAQAQQLQPLSVSPTVSVSETFTDNVGLDPDGEKDPALITTVSPGLAVTADLLRVTANVTGHVDVHYQTLSDEDLDINGALSGFTNVEWLEDLFFTDFRASVSQELLDTQQGRSASSNNTKNLDTVQNYQVSPYLTNRLGDYADSELRYLFGYTESKSSSLSKTLDHNASWILNSGPDFERLRWSTVARYNWLHRPNDNDVQSYSGELDLRLVLDPVFSVLGNAGYQRFDDNQDNEFSEVIWEAGFLITPGPSFELSYLFGKRDDAKSHSGSLRYDITARTSLRASYSESLTTDQSRLGQNLAAIGSGSGGSQINTTTNQTFSSNTSTTSIGNETTRTKTATVNLLSSFGRSTVGLNGGFQDRNVRNANDDERAWTAGLDLSRQLTPTLSGDIGVFYERRLFEVSPNTQIYRGQVGLSYALTQSVSTSARYSYQTRKSRDRNEEFTENTVTVGVDIAF